MKSADAGILAHGFALAEEPPRQPLPNGTSVGPYRILSLLASGGMGDVYRARDERLGRSVALKVLPTGLTDDRDRVERFAQEAKSASALNHPHIVTIYEIGQARPSCIVQPIAGTNQRQRPEEIHYIAMELIEGETLREFITSNPTIARRIEVLAQTAEGLGKAHAAGIVHRDLKPDNIMITAEGYAKVVDFGLAKLVETAHGWNPIGADSPTMRALTQQGELIGTAGYMSPEQILGKVIDQRSDIFSFGCIVYEAISGARPFNGDSFVDTLHEVLHSTPPPIGHPNDALQHELRRIIGKCLEKDREVRYQSIRDVALDLRAAASGANTHTETARPKESARKPFRGAGWLAVAAAAVIIGVIAWQIHLRVRSSSPANAAAHSVLQRITTNGHVSHLAISPDGRFAAYTLDDETAGPTVWLQQIATGSRVPILTAPPKTEYAGLAFSADGNHLLATRYDGTIFGTVVQVPLLGGTAAHLISDADTAITASPDGKLLAVIRNVLEKGESRLLLTAPDGSHERVLATLPLTEGMMTPSPSWSPDGTRIAVSHGNRLFSVDVKTGDKTAIPMTSSEGSIRDVAWSNAGDALLVTAYDDRWAGHCQLLRVDLATGTVSNVTDDADDYAEPHAAGKSVAAIQSKYQSAIWSVTPGAAPAQLTRGLGSSDGLSGLTAAPDRRIIYSSTAGGTADLWIANADGSDAHQLTNDERLEKHPVVTGNGTTIVYLRRNQEQSSLWRMNIDGGQQREIASAPMIYDYILTPDGKQIVYASGNDATSVSSLTRVPVDGGKSSAITTAGAFLRPLQITPDGRTIIFSSLDGQAIRLFKVAMNGGAVTKLTSEASNYGSISPDGKLIACAWKSPFNPKLAILSIDGGAPSRILDLSGRLYRWTPDGKGIVYIKHDGHQENLYMLPVAGGSPVALTNFTEGSIANFDWSADGTRVLLTHYIQTRDVVLLGAS